MDIDSFVLKIQMEEGIEALIKHDLKDFIKREKAMGITRAKIMINNREILKRERKIRKNYLESNGLDFKSLSKKAEERADEKRGIKVEVNDLESDDGMSDIGVPVTIENEDITMIQNREKTKARLAEEEEDHAEFKKRKAFLDEAKKLQKERVEARKVLVKNFLENLTPEQKMSHKGLRILARKYGL